MSAAEEDQPLRPVPRHRYVDFQIAGEGAMGLVYLARDTELRRDVAFKIVRPGEKPSTPLDASAPELDTRFAALSARFLQEAWVTGGMEHPGIAPVYEVGRTDGGVPYYTMRFVRGQRTLQTAIAELADQPLEQRLGVLEPFLKLCDAVSYAHARGVIHRDLKPANVALGEFGEVVLLDWGLAKLLAHGGAALEAPVSLVGPTEDFQTDGLGLGTPGYMPPEAVRGGVDELDDRSDVYSLGVILFQILTGRLPFAPERFSEYLHAVLHEDAPSAASLEPAVSGVLDSLCADALCRDRDGRLPSVRALSDGVRQWQSQTALEREMEGWLRDAKSALAAAEDAKGPARIRQTQRAITVLEAARARRPESERLKGLQATARALHNRGIQETQRIGRQRLVLVGGVSLLALLSIAAFSVAAHLNERRKEAEQANRAAEVALADATAQREEADRQSRAAEDARQEAELEAAKARDARDLVSTLVREMQKADEGGGRVADVLAAGMAMAVAQGNPDGVFLLLEQGLDERPFAQLAVGAAIRGRTPPPDLAAAVARTRRRTGEAYRTYLAALQERPFEKRQQAMTELETARANHDRALAAVLVALAADVDPAPSATPTLDQIQATLQPTDAFVSYVRVRDFALAVVIEKTATQLVSLGEARPIDESLAQFRDALRDPQGGAPPLELLRRKLVERLALPPGCRRVFVVPEAATSLVPFGLLLPEREVCIVPSAAAYLHLRALPPTGGTGILAVAGAVQEEHASLPGARAEAEAIGTTVLLGADATPGKLEAALSRQAPWRAIHVGLRGRIAGATANDVRLEASPGDDDDGHVGAQAIARFDARADLVVLATASVSTLPADVGATSLDLPQALLYAGARRVLFPTAFGDDEATQALMVRFYELWNPRTEPGAAGLAERVEGSPPKGLSAAAALSAAQAYVRDHPDHPKWKHPYYWAAWVLWGLSE